MTKDLETHIVQSPEWGEFKRRMGTPPVRVGDLQFTKHPIPFTPYYVGYAPRVNLLKQKFSWVELKNCAKQEKCAFIRFDVPNVLRETSKSSRSHKIISSMDEKCTKAPKSTFAKWNVLMDLSASEEDIIANFNQKTRYNSRLAARRGVSVKIENNDKGLKTFYKLHKETSIRQGFLTHSEKYFTEVFRQFRDQGKANILIANYNGVVLGAWMLFNHGNTLYYPYGGSSVEHKEVMASNLIAYESIRLGKKLGCTKFDMWGATNDKTDSFWGFTKFKLGYGGELVEYIDSYDFVVNPFVYRTFNFAYSTFWKIAKHPLLIGRSTEK